MYSLHQNLVCLCPVNMSSSKVHWWCMVCLCLLHVYHYKQGTVNMLEYVCNLDQLLCIWFVILLAEKMCCDVRMRCSSWWGSTWRVCRREWYQMNWCWVIYRSSVNHRHCKPLHSQVHTTILSTTRSCTTYQWDCFIVVLTHQLMLCRYCLWTVFMLLVTVTAAVCAWTVPVSSYLCIKMLFCQSSENITSSLTHNSTVVLIPFTSM